ncbi:MAG: hypothetical protein GEU73_02735 [Chloroflexi bacterium]|nr:hypothetical protein [Chloroflexota bacterium]
MTVQDSVWTNRELLEQNRQRLMRELRETLRTYEARYELPSSAVQNALADGSLRDTAEVCEWVIALHTLQAIEREQ